MPACAISPADRRDKFALSEMIWSRITARRVEFPDIDFSIFDFFDI